MSNLSSDPLADVTGPQPDHTHDSGEFPRLLDEPARCSECHAAMFYPHDPNCSKRRLTMDAVLEKDVDRGALDTMAMIQRNGDAQPLTSSEALNLLGQAPSHLPVGSAERKGVPLATGVIDYFPDALVALAVLSRIGNDQHNPGKPLHWDRSKSGDEADTLLRHFLDRGTYDTDGVRHSTKVAWRALALLQKEIELSRI